MGVEGGGGQGRGGRGKVRVQVVLVLLGLLASPLVVLVGGSQGRLLLQGVRAGDASKGRFWDAWRRRWRREEKVVAKVALAAMAASATVGMVVGREGGGPAGVINPGGVWEEGRLGAPRLNEAYRRRNNTSCSRSCSSTSSGSYQIPGVALTASRTCRDFSVCDVAYGIIYNNIRCVLVGCHVWVLAVVGFRLLLCLQGVVLRVVVVVVVLVAVAHVAGGATCHSQLHLEADKSADQMLISDYTKVGL